MRENRYTFDMVRMRLVFLNTILITFLAIALAGFLFTMFRIRLPLPWILVRFSYNMMAPYQGDTDENEELVAEGLTDNGAWAYIDLHPYLPFGDGERNVRMYLRSFRKSEDELALGAYQEFAKKLFEREHARDIPWKSVRLVWEEWPRSPLGFNAARMDAVRTPIVTVP